MSEMPGNPYEDAAQLQKQLKEQIVTRLGLDGAVMTDIHALLARVAELDGAATDGPWTWASRETVDGDSWAVFDTADHAVASNNDGWTRDADLIAEYRTAAPALARALQAVLKVLYVEMGQADRDLERSRTNHSIGERLLGRHTGAYRVIGSARQAIIRALKAEG